MSAARYIDTVVKGSSLTAYTIADRAMMDINTLYKIRTEKQRLTSDHAYNIANALSDYNVIDEQCCSCYIGKKLNLVRLNGKIRDQGHEILWKSKTEIKEFLEVLPKMIEILFDNDDYTVKEREFIDKGFHEALDVEHCIKTLRSWYAKKFGIDELVKRVQEHNDKCYDNNYAIKE